MGPISFVSKGRRHKKSGVGGCMRWERGSAWIDSE